MFGFAYGEKRKIGAVFSSIWQLYNTKLVKAQSRQRRIHKFFRLCPVLQWILNAAKKHQECLRQLEIIRKKAYTKTLL